MRIAQLRLVIVTIAAATMWVVTVTAQSKNKNSKSLTLCERRKLPTSEPDNKSMKNQFHVPLPDHQLLHLHPYLTSNYPKEPNAKYREKTIKQHIGKEPRRCRGKPSEEVTFVIEVGTAGESRLMSTLLKIREHNVVVTVNNTHDVQKGLIYIQGYDILDFEGYKEGLRNHQNITTTDHAHWIKTRNNLSQALIVGFQGQLPNYLDIPGETMRTPVHEYKRLPNHCKKCLYVFSVCG